MNIKNTDIMDIISRLDFDNMSLEDLYMFNNMDISSLTADECYIVANNYIIGRWGAAEAIIATDAFHACNYAYHVIDGRWLEAEPIIATDSDMMSSYCSLFNIKPSQLYNPNNIVNHVDVLVSI